MSFSISEIEFIADDARTLQQSKSFVEPALVDPARLPCVL
jgi:hypothetical protein